MSLRELERGTDDTPDDRGRAEDSGTRASEAALGLLRADALDVREEPCLDTELDGTGDDGGDNLAPEHRARRDFHVVAELKVLGEL